VKFTCNGREDKGECLEVFRLLFSMFVCGSLGKS